MSVCPVRALCMLVCVLGLRVRARACVRVCVGACVWARVCAKLKLAPALAPHQRGSRPLPPPSRRAPPGARHRLCEELKRRPQLKPAAPTRGCHNTQGCHNTRGCPRPAAPPPHENSRGAHPNTPAEPLSCESAPFERFSPNGMEAGRPARAFMRGHMSCARARAGPSPRTPLCCRRPQARARAGAAAALRACARGGRLAADSRRRGACTECAPRRAHICARRRPLLLTTLTR